MQHEHAASVRHMAATVRWESAMRRHRVPQDKKSPAGGVQGVAISFTPTAGL
jgi:hypothetical protein